MLTLSHYTRITRHLISSLWDTKTPKFQRVLHCLSVSYFIFKAIGRQKHFSDFSALRLGTLFFPLEVRTGIWKGVLSPATGRRRGRSFVSFPRPCTTISSRGPGMGKEERSAHTLPPRVPTSRTPAATGTVPPGSGPAASAPGRALPPREVQHPGPGELGNR